MYVDPPARLPARRLTYPYGCRSASPSSHPTIHLYIYGCQPTSPPVQLFIRMPTYLQALPPAWPSALLYAIPPDISPTGLRAYYTHPLAHSPFRLNLHADTPIHLPIRMTVDSLTRSTATTLYRQCSFHPTPLLAHPSTSRSPARTQDYN